MPLDQLVKFHLDELGAGEVQDVCYFPGVVSPEFPVASSAV